MYKIILKNHFWSVFIDVITLELFDGMIKPSVGLVFNDGSKKVIAIENIKKIEKQ